MRKQWVEPVAALLMVLATLRRKDDVIEFCAFPLHSGIS